MSALGETISGSRAPAPGLIITRAVPRCNRREAVTAQPHPVGTPWRLAAGHVIFIRRVSMAGTVSVLRQSFRVGKWHRRLYLRLVMDIAHGWTTAYLNG